MPTYEYQCENCNYRFDIFQSITAGQLRKCPQCSKPKLKRLLGTGAGIIFKGSGFYETDYRSEGYKKAAEKEKTSSTPSTKEKTPTDTKVQKSESLKEVHKASKNKKQ